MVSRLLTGGWVSDSQKGAFLHFPLLTTFAAGGYLKDTRTLKYQLNSCLNYKQHFML